MNGSLSPIYALSLLGVAAWWLTQVAALSRQSQWPRLGFLMPLGLAALLGAPASALDVPALFGLGLGFALIAAYYPLPRLHRAPQAGSWIMAAALLLSSAAALSTAVLLQNFYVLMLGAAALLYGLLLLLSAWFYPKGGKRTPLAAAPAPHERQRWQPTHNADPPDFELSLEYNQARLLNISPYALEVLGWSPARRNAWLSAQPEGSGRYLGSGQSAFLPHWEPLAPENGGVRVWYIRKGSPEVYLFRADWQATTPQAHSKGRLLN